MPKTKVEVYDKDQLIYPFIESDHVTFSNGMKVTEMLDQSISMPTITHNETSFKVGVGDSDVSSSIVDSSVSKMVIKGQTYQNILPEPSTHVLTNNKEMFKVNEGLDPNVEIVDGVNKSAILSGQTLVNVLAYIKVGGNVPLVKNGNVIEVESTTENTWRSVDIDFTYLKPNTKYIVTWDSITFSNTNFVPTSSLISVRLKTDNTQIAGWDSSRNYIIATVPSDTSDVKLRVHASQGTAMINKTTVKGLKVVEYVDGMENWDIPYFEGMQSVKMPVLTTTGKNLFDGVLLQGYIGDNTGESNSSSQGVHSPSYIKVKPNTSYVKQVASMGEGYPRNAVSRVYFYDENKTYLKTYAQDNCFTTPSNAHYIRIRFFVSNGNITPENFNGSNIQIEESSIATPYEPYKSNILSTPEEVVLRKVNGVKDTLNLNTGEYVQRTKEIVLNGSENWRLNKSLGDGSFHQFVVSIVQAKKVAQQLVVCDKLVSEPNESINNRIWIYDGTTMVIHSSCRNVDEMKTWLQQNPLTVQYELATPVMKTVDLSSSGNWEKIVFNGSENWNKFSIDSMINHSQFYFRIEDKLHNSHVLCDSFVSMSRQTSDNGGECVSGDGGNGKNIWINILNSRLTSLDVNGFKQYLQQNPMTVWYQTEPHKDSTQVKQPIFFKDGHIQLSSGADDSLIPTLDYQAKTSNSYVMDLIKVNTRYTMKAKTASGTFTIDGTSYGAGTNGTFTTPTSMANKLLVMSNKTNTEVMILEGDVTSKTIPYFKGIKSAFEGEDKIEVLSTGRNLCPPQPEIEGHYVRYQNGTYTQNDSYNVSKPIRVIEGHRYRLINTNKHHAYYDKNMNYVTTPLFSGSDVDFYSIAPKNAVYLRVSMMKGLEVVVNTDGAKGEYREPNSTKIPLLSPLRSLPNGVYDEIILDRENNKAKIIQRVGELDFSNLQYNTWIVSDSTLSKTVRFTWLSSNMSFYKVKDSSDGICDSIPYIRYNSSDTEHCRFDGSNPSAFMIWVDKSKLTSFDDKGLKKYLSTFPSTRVQYELATPVITEVDLEGFPYIYKDGHIFLNSKIVSTTEIIYSVNQCQQISASNEDIIRHEKELTYLQKLIAQYVQVNYESVLLSLKV